MNRQFTIQVLGTGDNKYMILKQSAQLALNRLGNSTIISEVKDVDSFIDLGISKIPALAIDGNIVWEDGMSTDPSVIEEIIVQTLNDNQKTMKILVPMDFSIASQKALDGALQWALNTKAEILVLHTFHPESAFGQEISMTIDLMRSSKKTLLDKLIEEKVDKIESEGVPPISSFVHAGLAGDEILNFIRDRNIGLVFMGSTGEGNWLNKVFGSITQKVAQHADCPVIIIPASEQYHDVKNILYAASEKAMKDVHLKTLIDLNKYFNAAVHFVTVKLEGKDRPEFNLKENLDRLVGKVDFPFSFDSIEGNSVWESLNAYAVDHNIDLLIIVNHHRKILDNILGRSETTELIGHCSVPLLVMHGT